MMGGYTYRDRLIKYAVEMGSDAMIYIYIPRFMAVP
jgi:hypothetical protein